MPNKYPSSPGIPVPPRPPPPPTPASHYKLAMRGSEVDSKVSTTMAPSKPDSRPKKMPPPVKRSKGIAPEGKVVDQDIQDLVDKEIPKSLLEEIEDEDRLFNIAGLAVSLLPHLDNIRWPRIDSDEMEAGEEESNNQDNISDAAQAAVTILAASEFHLRKYRTEQANRREQRRESFKWIAPDPKRAVRISTLKGALKELYPNADGFKHRRSALLKTLEKAHAKAGLVAIVRLLNIDVEKGHESEIPQIVCERLSHIGISPEIFGELEFLVKTHSRQKPNK